MPDTRTHRGPHPEDAGLFAPARWPALRRAAAEVCWLLDRGYALRSSLALVGDRHNLTQRQRLAIARSACAAQERDRRASHEVSLGDTRGSELWIDGYNLLISVEAALGGGVILLGRDGCIRDLASLHGTYRSVEETGPAIELVGEALAECAVGRCRWLLDRPVSNSGRLKKFLLITAATRGWDWNVDLEFSPDALLSRTAAVVVSSDSAVLDRCERWVNLAAWLLARRVPRAFIVDLRIDA
jgi:hypothetical protein